MLPIENCSGLSSFLSSLSSSGEEGHLLDARNDIAEVKSIQPGSDNGAVELVDRDVLNQRRQFE